MAGKYMAYPEYKDSGTKWFGHIPVDWELATLRRSLLEHKQGYYTTEAYVDDGVKLLRITDLRDYGEIDISGCPKVSDSDQSLESYELKNSDVVFARTGGAGSFGVVKNIGERVVFASYLIRFRFSENSFINDYLRYMLLADSFQKSVKQNIHGGVNQNIHAEDIKNTYLARPPHLEQEKIANFLDHETAKIDTLIEKQELLIKLLKEKRQAVISHAVTKGLNPDAPMRDSGVEWLGEVPEHWDVKKFKFLCDRIIAGPFGSSITKDMYVKQGYKIYGQEQVIPNNFKIGDYYISEKNFLVLSRYIVSEGDILISCVGTFGKIAVFPKGAEPGIINPRLIKAEVSRSHNPHYIRELLKSEMVFKQFELLSRGGTMGVINIAILSEILATVPPVNEQSEVVEFINQQKEKFSTLIEQANKAVQLLQERRAALISAAVTGKVDVRNWQIPELLNKNGKGVAV